MRTRLLRLASLLAFILPVVLEAQSTQTDLQTQLIQKPLYLRGFWRDRKLKFDATGHLIGPTNPSSFTFSGIEVHSVKLKSDRLVISGDRIGLKFEKFVPKRVKLDEKIEIEIAPSPSQDYGPAIHAIFADDLVSLVPDLPSYWQPYAQKYILNAPWPAKPESAAATTGVTASRIGGTVSRPVPLAMPDPAFSAAAREMKLSGSVLVYLWVDKQGRPGHLSIVRPLGLGLDEQALGSVAAYSFRPAMRNGEPVVVEMNVEVNFQIF